MDMKKKVTVSDRFDPFDTDVSTNEWETEAHLSCIWLVTKEFERLINEQQWLECARANLHTYIQCTSEYVYICSVTKLCEIIRCTYVMPVAADEEYMQRAGKICSTLIICLYMPKPSSVCLIDKRRRNSPSSNTSKRINLISTSNRYEPNMAWPVMTRIISSRMQTTCFACTRRKVNAAWRWWWCWWW